MGAGAWHYLVPPGVEIRSSDPRFDTPLATESILRRVVPHPDGGSHHYLVTLGTARYFQVIQANPGEQLTVTWEWRPVASETRIEDWTVWRAGAGTAPVPGGDPDSPEHSVVLLRGLQDDPAVRRLALRLLDSGSAQAVALLDPDTAITEVAFWPQALLAPGLSQQVILIDAAEEKFEPSGLIPTAMVVIGQGFDGSYAWIQADAAELTQKLDFPGWQALATLSAKGSFRIPYTRGTPKLRGRPGTALTDPTRAPFVILPGGTFVMGSPEEEPGRDSDEGPQHQARVPIFAIMATEVTNAQYAAFLNAVGRRGSKEQSWFESRQEDSQSYIEGRPGAWRASPGFEWYPVANVSWYGAQAFCAHYGGRLPTETEWEYAVRAGTDTAWSFDADAAAIDQYAWYSGNSGDKPRAVATKRPNPWGLYDMHGNLWEWVEDCWHEDYQGAPDDGSAWVDKDCPYRVVRGGSFYYPSRLLRSANRDWFQPVDRIVLLGFRCVRSLSPGMGPLTN